MCRSKKFIIAALLATVLLVGSIAGVAFAQTASGDGSQSKTLLDRVATILVGKGINITSQQLKEAFTQAQSQMRDEALDKRLQKLVGEGKITNEQVGQYKAWLQARPNMEPFRQQLEQWQQARPNLPQARRPDHGFGGHNYWGGQ